MNLFNFLKNSKLKTKITLFSVIIILLSASVISIVSFNRSKVALEKSIINDLNNIAQLKADKIELLFNMLKPSVKFAQEFPSLKRDLYQLSVDYKTKSIDSIYNSLVELNTFLSVFQKEYGYEEIKLISLDGTTIFNSENKVSFIMGESFRFGQTNYFKQAKKGLTISPLFEDNKHYYVYLLAPITNYSNVTVGVLACKYEMSEIFDAILDYKGLGKTGETLLAELRGDEVVFLNPLRHDVTAALKRKVKLGSKRAIPIQEAVMGKKGNGFDIDYRNEKVIASWVYISDLNWGLVAKIDVAEAYAPINELKYGVFIATSIVLLIAMLIAWFFAKNISQPIVELKSMILRLGKGELPKYLDRTSKDEIGLMITATNDLVGALGNTAEFAEKIGKNELDAEYCPLGEADVLGESLLSMRRKLKEAQDVEYRRNWITKGLAQFATILRENNDNLELLSINIITNLVKYIGVNQGGLFIVNSDVSPEKLELTAMYAYDRRKYLEKEFEKGQGLIGQCWQEGEKIYITDVPQGYVNVTSGLGESNPNCILIVPLKINDSIHGVVEIASFEILEDYKVEFLEKLSESIASTVSSTKTNLQTTYLLQESKEMTEELRAQEEEMRQNMEEMQATQEEMERITEEKDSIILTLQNKISSLNNSNDE